MFADFRFGHERLITRTVRTVAEQIHRPGRSTWASAVPRKPAIGIDPTPPDRRWKPTRSVHCLRAAAYLLSTQTRAMQRKHAFSIRAPLAIEYSASSPTGKPSSADRHWTDDLCDTVLLRRRLAATPQWLFTYLQGGWAKASRVLTWRSLMQRMACPFSRCIHDLSGACKWRPGRNT